MKRNYADRLFELPFEDHSVLGGNSLVPFSESKRLIGDINKKSDELIAKRARVVSADSQDFQDKERLLGVYDELLFSLGAMARQALDQLIADGESLPRDLELGMVKTVARAAHVIPNITDPLVEEIEHYPLMPE